MKSDFRLIRIIKEEIQDFNYRGEHEAPSPLSDDSPMHDVEDVYPDIYGDNGIEYYGYDNNDYINMIHLIKRVKGKPNTIIKIYRSVPDINREVRNELKIYQDLLNYYDRFGFFPMKNKIVNSLQDEYQEMFDRNLITYDGMMLKIIEEIKKKYSLLYTKLKNPIKINNGDWVTPSINYAKEHGVSNLNNKFKIISKSVKVSELYTDGNDLLEWGYYGK